MIAVPSGPALTTGALLGAVQLTENVVVAVPPEGTLTVREGPPLTLQLPATPEMATVWLPGVRFV